MRQLRAIVERVERLETEIADLNSDKSDIFKEAKANGFDVKALKSVIAYRRKDPTERAEHETLVGLYLAELLGKSSAGTDPATRARARSEQPAAPASGTEKLRQDLQASIAAEGMPDMPGFLDRRPQ